MAYLSGTETDPESGVVVFIFVIFIYLFFFFALHEPPSETTNYSTALGPEQRAETGCFWQGFCPLCTLKPVNSKTSSPAQTYSLL